MNSTSRLIRLNLILSLFYIVTKIDGNIYANSRALAELIQGLQNLSNIESAEQVDGEKFDFQNTVISINHTVENFNKKTSCGVQAWSNKLENACKCCLIQNAPELDTGKPPSEVLQICLNKKECDNSVIEEMLNQEKIAYRSKEKNLRELISHLYNKSIIIKEVLPHNIKFNHDGSFTEDSAKEFLAQAYEEKKLRIPNFRSASCLNVTDILSEKGYMTSQLFSVTSNCLSKETNYILKEMTAGTSEVIYLQRSSLIPGLTTYLYPATIQGFPSFVLPLAYISYNYAGREHYLSLMLKAPGILLSSLVTKYKNQAVSKSDIEEAYYQTGFTLSNFHKKFMSDFKQQAKPGQLLNTTYIQGDAHQSNIFYDKVTNRVTFIDNEKFTVRSPGNPFLDIEAFIFITLNHLIPNHIKNDQKFLNDWIFLTAKNFLEGYISAYNMDDKSKVLEELVHRFNDSTSYLFPASYRSYQNYRTIFEKIFEEFRNDISKHQGDK